MAEILRINSRVHIDYSTCQHELANYGGNSHGTSKIICAAFIIQSEIVNPSNETERTMISCTNNATKNGTYFQRPQLQQMLLELYTSMYQYSNIFHYKLLLLKRSNRKNDDRPGILISSTFR